MLEGVGLVLVSLPPIGPGQGCKLPIWRSPVIMGWLAVPARCVRLVPINGVFVRVNHTVEMDLSLLRFKYGMGPSSSSMFTQFSLKVLCLDHYYVSALFHCFHDFYFCSVRLRRSRSLPVGSPPRNLLSGCGQLEWTTFRYRLSVPSEENRLLRILGFLVIASLLSFTTREFLRPPGFLYVGPSAL